MKKNNILKQDYEKACNAYLRAFCEKHGYDYDAIRSWVGDEAGTIAEVGDLYVGMEDIRTDIDQNAPEEEFLKWYDYCLRLHAVTEGRISAPNFRSWLKDCPRHDEAWFHEVEELRLRTEQAKRDLEEQINKNEF